MIFRFIHDYCWGLILGLPIAFYLAMEHLETAEFRAAAIFVIMGLWILAASEALE